MNDGAAAESGAAEGTAATGGSGTGNGTGTGTGNGTGTGIANGSAASVGAGTGALSNGAAQVPVNYFASLDPETQGWLQNKGYFGPDLTKADLAKGLPEILKAHRGLESMIGKNRLPAPKDAADTEAYEAIYKALGRPGDPAGYGIKMPEGGNKEYFDGMLSAFHKAGLSDTQVRALVQASGDLSTKAAAEAKASADATFATQSASELAAIRNEWKGDADRNFAAAQRATLQFGLDRPTLEKMERAIGTKTMLGFLAKVGQGLTEDRGTGQGTGGAPFAPTPEAAQARINELHADKDWVKRYTAGGATEKAEYNRLLNVLAEAA